MLDILDNNKSFEYAKLFVFFGNCTMFMFLSQDNKLLSKKGKRLNNSAE